MSILPENRLILMAWLIPVGWRDESLAQTTATSPSRKSDEAALVRELDSEYTLTYLSQKDKIDRVARIPEIRLARPGLSVFTRQVVKFKSEAR